MNDYTETITKTKIYTFSNFLSLLRILILPVIYIVYKDGSEQFLLYTLIIVCISTDYFDGYFARKLKQATELGRILDPIADKIAIFFGVFLMAAEKSFPWVVVIAFLVRDLTIVVLGSVLVKKKHSVPESNMHGKLTTTFMSICLFIYFVDSKITVSPFDPGMFGTFTWAEWLKVGMLYLGIVFFILSSISYGKKYAELSKKK